jgi:hypothetical protein
MATGATLSAEEQRQVDDLLPPPWPTARRMAVAGVALLLVVGSVVAVRSGVLVPQLTTTGWGSNVDAADPERLRAELLVTIHNRGLVPATIERIELPAISGVTWGEEVQGQHATVGRGGSVQLTVPFVVAGCDVDVGGSDVLPLRAGGPVGPARTVAVSMPWSTDPTMRTTYQADDGSELTLPSWPDQSPSWILDAIEAPCASPPDGFDG